MFYNIRKKIFYKNLKKEFANLEPKRKRNLKSFENIKSFLIVFDASNEEIAQQVFSIINELKENGSLVHTIGFVPFKNIPHYCFPKLSYDYIYNKNTNFFLTPNAPFVKDVTNSEFDVLIDFSGQIIEPLLYISALSKSALKITRNKTSTIAKEIYDLTINDENISIKEFFFQVKKYLKALSH